MPERGLVALGVRGSRGAREGRICSSREADHGSQGALGTASVVAVFARTAPRLTALEQRGRDPGALHQRSRAAL
jgi:hypothetical protein